MPKEYDPFGSEEETRDPVKVIQPIQIDWLLAKDLVKAGVMRPPTVPKMEAMEKWILARGWDLSIGHDKETGQTMATVTAPMDDGPKNFYGFDATMAMATAKAIQYAWASQPQQSSFLDSDEDEADLPEKEQMTLAPHPESVATMMSEPPDEDFVPGPPIEQPRALGGWSFLFIVDPNDSVLWKVIRPSGIRDGDDGSQAYPLVDWEEGDDLNDRGWYLAPGYAYDHQLGIIALEDDNQVLWSREEAHKPVKKSRKPKTQDVDWAKAEALQAADGIVADSVKSE